MNDVSFPLAIALLGVAALAGFLAFRPWPMPDGKPIEPGSYAISILQGKVPAASNPPDRQTDITTIQTGLLALLGVWTASKLASMLSNLGGPTGGAGGSDEATGEDEGKAGGEEIEGDVKSALPDIETGAADVEGAL